MFANVIIILFFQLVSIKSPYLFSRIKNQLSYIVCLYNMKIQKKLEKLVNI